LFCIRIRAALYLFACLVFVVIGMTQVAQRRAGMTGWPCVLFFGIGAAVLSVRFVPGASYLRLRGDGFRFCSLFRTSPLFLWRDVSGFRVARLPSFGHPVVIFDWRAAPDRGASPAQAHARFLRDRRRSKGSGTAGSEGGLPGTHGTGKPLSPPEATSSDRWKRRGAQGCSTR